MLDECKELDIMIAQKFAEANGDLQGESDFNQYVQILRDAKARDTEAA